MLEKSVHDLISKRVKALGYRIVLINYFSRAKVLQIMIDFEEGMGSVSIEDCVKASNEISVLLSVNEVISGDWAVEVSSPGLDRPLVSLSDFVKYKGRKVKLIMRRVINGVRKCNANILDVVNDARIVFELYNAQKIDVSLDDIESAKLSLDGINLFKN